MIGPDPVPAVHAQALEGAAEGAGTREDVEDVERALRAAETGSAGHWPTVAAVLRDEVLRLREVAAGVRRVAEDTAAVLDKIADELTGRARRREQIGGDNEDECEDECEETTCHTVAAVSTWHNAAVIVRARAAALRGPECDR